MFADAEVFWKPPNVYDAIGVLGFVLGVLGFFVGLYSIRLALQDIKTRIREAADGAVERLATALLQQDVVAARQNMELARAACRSRQWKAAVRQCDIVIGLMLRLVPIRRLPDDVRGSLRIATDSSRRVRETVVRQPRDGQGGLDSGVIGLLDETIETLLAVEGRFAESLWEV